METDSARQVGSRVLPVVSMNHAVNDGSVYLLTSLFPVVLTLFGLSVFQVGILVGAGYLVSVVGQPIVGRYSERADPRKLLAVGLSVISFSVLSFVFASGFLSILASVLLLRAGSCFYHPVGVSAVSKAYQGKSLDRAMGIQSAFGNLGILLVFVLSAPIYLAIGWKATFVFFALVSAADVVITLAAFRGSRPGASQAPKNGPQGAKQARLGLPVFFLVLSFVSGASFAVILNYANILVENQSHVGVLPANIVVSGWIALSFLGAISTGRWPRVVPRTTFLFLSFLLSAVTTVVIVFTSSDLTLVVPVLLANGFTVSATYPLLYSELSDFLSGRSETTGRSFGVIFSAQTIGASAFGLVSGYLSSLYGIPSAFLVVAALMLVGSGMALARTRSVRNGPGGQLTPA